MDCDFPTRACAVILADGTTTWAQTLEAAMGVVDSFKAANPGLNEHFHPGAFMAGFVALDLTPAAYARLFPDIALTDQGRAGEGR